MDRIINDTIAEVVSLQGDHIHVKLASFGVEVTFPRSQLSEPSRVGSKFRCQVLERSNGTRYFNLVPISPETPLRDLDTIQARIEAWVKSVFGEEVAVNSKERAFRFVEEAIELGQALDLEKADVHALVDYVYSRPVGEPSQEIAGSMVTLCATASALGINVADATLMEADRIETPEIRAKVRSRQSEKRALGFIAKS